VAVSCIPEVKQALLTGLAADADATTLVEWGVPHEAWEGVQGEWIVLGDATAPQEPRALGQLKRDETVDLEVYVDVRRATTDQEAVTRRAFVIAGVIEDHLRADPSLAANYAGGGQIVDAQFAGVRREASSAADRQRRSVLTCTVRVRARI